MLYQITQEQNLNVKNKSLVNNMLYAYKLSQMIYRVLLGITHKVRGLGYDKLQ